MNEMKLVLAVVLDAERGWMSVCTGATLAGRGRGKLEVLAIAEPPPLPNPFLLSDSLGDEYLDAVADALEGKAREFVARAGLPAASVRVSRGHPAQVVSEASKEMGADLVVLGGMTHGFLRSVAATLAEPISHVARCQVLLTPEAREKPYSRILAGVGLMSRERAVVSAAAEMAELNGAALRVVHVREVVPMIEHLGLFDEDALRGEAESQLHAILADLGLPDEIEHSAVVRHGRAGHEILEEAADWDADLVVIGSRGEGVLGHLLRMGTSARHILHHNDTATLVIPCGEREGGSASVSAQE